MPIRDLSPEINAVASRYHFGPVPDFVLQVQEILSGLLRTITEWLRYLLNMRFGGPGDNRGVSDLMQLIVYAAGLVGVVILCVVLFRRVQSDLRSKKVKTNSSVQIEELLDAAGWKQQGISLASEKDFRGACRALYLSVLQLMHEQSVAEFAPTKTNYEYSYVLAPYPKIEKDFRQLADAVETIWFGFGAADEAEFKRTLSLLESLEPTIKQTGELKKEQLERMQY